MSNNYRDFDNYLKEFPNAEGYFGEYGGSFQAEELIEALLYKESDNTKLDDMDTGYALWQSEGGKSGFMKYYDFMFDKLVLLDKAMLWYKNNLNDDDFEAFKTKIFADASKALNKANEMLTAYEEDGSLPLGKNISDLKEIEAFAKIFNKVEDKLVKFLKKYESTIFYTNAWDADSVRNDLPYVELGVDVLLGNDNPVFNLDSLFENEYVQKALDKAGFEDVEHKDTSESVTVYSVKRQYKDNYIKLRRYFEYYE